MNARSLGMAVGLMLWCVGLAFPAWAQGDDGEIARLTRENTQLRAQVEALAAELETLRQELAALRQDNRQLASETQVLEEQTAELQAMAGVATEDQALAMQAERIRSVYDPEADRTAVTFGAEPLEAEGSAGEFYFSVVYSHEGQEPVAVESATLFLQAYRTGRLFQGQEAAEFLINDEPVPFVISGIDVTPRKTGQPGRTRTDRSDEIVEFKIDRATLARLGDARRLSIQNGRVVVTFDLNDLAAMRAVAQRMQRPTTAPQ